jgi:hypothetical protein
MSKRIMYLRDNNNPQGKGNPIGCVAIQIDDLTNGDVNISYNVSVCHPNDKFERNLAKVKALGYLESEPLNAGLITEKCVSIHQISSIVMSQINLNKSLPKRVRQSAKRWLTAAAQLKA